MSQDLKTKVKKLTGSVWPEGTIDASPGLDRYEPLLDARLFQSRFLGGIVMAYPVTKQKITQEDLEDFIHRAINQVEMDTQTTVLPTIRRFRLPFDPNLYQNFIWCEIPAKPIQKVLRLAICSASYSATPQANDKYPSGAELYSIPLEWCDVSYAAHGKISVLPLNPAFSAIGTSTAVGASGATILQFVGAQGWYPAFWNAEVVIGMANEENQVPIYINEIIGIKAALLFLDNLLLSYRFASQSIGIDGLSQSQADNAQGLIQARIQALEERYKQSVHKLKTKFGNSFYVSNV